MFIFFSVFLVPKFDKGKTYHYGYEVIVETSKTYSPKAIIKIECEVLVSAPSADTITMKVKLIKYFFYFFSV